jgi:hypothetical protein
LATSCIHPCSAHENTRTGRNHIARCPVRIEQLVPQNQAVTYKGTSLHKYHPDFFHSSVSATGNIPSPLNFQHCVIEVHKSLEISPVHSEISSRS